jgi:hypothetical protein
MSEHIIPKGDLKKLEIVSTGGSLYLTGWNREEIRIKDLTEQDLVKEKKDQISLTFVRDAVIHMPHSLETIVKAVSEDASIKGIKGNLEISSTGGDLILNDVGSVKIGSVGGDLIANRVQGDLRVENTGGDGIVDDIKGQISIQNLGGDVHLEKISGGIEINAGGDARLSFHPVPWQAYRINAGGDISATIPDDSSVDLSIKSGAEDITIKIGDLHIKLEENHLDQQIGEGGPAVMLTAGGDVYLTGDDFNLLTKIKVSAEELEDFAIDFSSQAAGQIKSHLSHLEDDIKQSLSGLSESLQSIGLTEENIQRITSQIEDSSHQAAQKAEVAAIKAQAKVEKKIAQARKQALKIKSKAKEFDLEKFLNAQENKRAVSADERLLILNMLQEKKISPEEADDLLRALEGKKKS